ncbi:hypothetical protein PSE10B_04490 [Pseudomonas amygdali pv. eriobotryae]|uniref:Effector protein hopM1 n=7 Tax=Pseudomonas syringae group TaxID=136849 RepID=A0A2K4WYY4_PSESX|nr:hypothetical protein AC519_1885 [Pseudomonas savastanoi]KPB63177.1 Effector protein hopM1 [Pseudomonas amygdali pv. myricae]KPW89969.1 Effector protein hopM1 [Pseudomonas syringae pv. cerasicola]KPW90666.1 Effector protein hopM1 [Pseudomonas syringae pv. castaneae]KPX95593.1 Effector protein hopM1 [Pseudomonas meliae]KPY52593.1 Effector protein hopM1 [Pseudomonas syringae pv. rhaphiolepidis]KPZ11085.1 Effector protein hopM1 [Pseudomonas amygdali pv. ulmi]KWS53268.1 hypothetical protein AL
MNTPRIGGSGGIELARINQQHDAISAQTAHPNAVTPGMNPPLTPIRQGRTQQKARLPVPRG